VTITPLGSLPRGEPPEDIVLPGMAGRHPERVARLPGDVVLFTTN
jgi:hypothetical protein